MEFLVDLNLVQQGLSVPEPLRRHADPFPHYAASVLSPKYEVFCRRSIGCFQGASEAPIYLSHTGRSAPAEEKQPIGPGPEGCDENGPAAALLVGHVSVKICSLLPPV